MIGQGVELDSLEAETEKRMLSKSLNILNNFSQRLHILLVDPNHIHNVNHCSRAQSKVLLSRRMENGDVGCQIHGKEAANWVAIKDLKCTCKMYTPITNNFNITTVLSTLEIRWQPGSDF